MFSTPLQTGVAVDIFDFRLFERSAVQVDVLRLIFNRRVISAAWCWLLASVFAVTALVDSHLEHESLVTLRQCDYRER